MEEEELESEIISNLDRLEKLDLTNLENFESLLLSEFLDSEKWKNSHLWTDCFRNDLESFEHRLLEFPEFRNFLINIGEIDAHIVCAPFYIQDQLNIWSEVELDRIANLPLCEEDNGREDSCFGVHFFITLNKNITENTLEKILEKEYDDEAYFPWLVARSSRSSAKLLGKVAENYKSASSWRAWGEYSEGLSILDNHRDSFVLWQVQKNPNTSKETLEKFKKEIAEIQLKDSAPADRYPF